MGLKTIDYNTLNQYMKQHFLESGLLTSISAACDHLIEKVDSQSRPAANGINTDEAKLSEIEFLQYLDRMPIDLELLKTVLASTHFHIEQHLNMNCLVYRHFNYSQPTLHDHDFIEICHVYTGSCQINVSGCETELNEGDFLFIPFGLPHSIAAPDKSSVVLCVLLPKIIVESICFFALSEKSFFHQYFHSMHLGTLSSILVCRQENDEKIRRMMRQLMVGGSFGNDSPLCNVIPGIIITIMDRLISNARVEYVDHSKNWNQNQLPDILNYISENFNNVTLENVAEKYHFNRSYLSRMIKNSTGLTYTEHLTHNRLLMGARLLNQTSLPVSRICEQVGYNDVTHFIRAFKKRYGQTPLVYRKSQHMEVM